MKSRVQSAGLERLFPGGNGRPHARLPIGALVALSDRALGGDRSVARQIQRELGAHRVKIIALAGWAEDEDRRRAREAGFDARLVNPAEMAALRVMLASLTTSAAQN
ncbi:MAG: hypothetical protein ABR570_06620 [Burkholderiales bacterium]